MSAATANPTFRGRTIPASVLDAMAYHGVTWESVFEDPIGKLYTKNSPKTIKGEQYGYVTSILYLAPARLSGLNACPAATAGCTQACLGTQSGHARIIKKGERSNNVLRSRIRKTLQFFYRREEFMAQLVKETAANIAKWENDGWIPVFRLNGTSDLRFETIPVERNGKEYPHVFAAFPDHSFYDYTKIANRRVAGIANYSLTFSLAESNATQARAAFLSGLNVAMVFRSDLPEEVTLGDLEIPVFDGDDSDLRFLDPRGVIVGLYAKGNAKKDTSGFVHDSATVLVDAPSLPVMACAA